MSCVGNAETRKEDCSKEISTRGRSTDAGLQFASNSPRADFGQTYGLRFIIFFYSGQKGLGFVVLIVLGQLKKTTRETAQWAISKSVWEVPGLKLANNGIQEP